MTIDMIDHSSLRRFSTGVPVRAMCCSAGRLRNALAVRVSGFFTACASSSTTAAHRTVLQRVDVACGDVVGGDDQVVLGDDVGKRGRITATRAVMHGDSQHRRESRRLGLPVAHDRQRADHQVRARQCGEVGERGGCLAEAHVVGQAAAETELVEELQPAETAPLIRTQRGHEPGRLDAFGQRRVGQTLQQVTEPAGGGDRRRVAVGGLCFLGSGQLGGQPQHVERRQLGMVASMFGEVGEGSPRLGAVESHPPPVDVDQAGARRGGALEQCLVDRCVVDHDRPVDDRRGAESAGSGGIFRLGDTSGGRRSPGQALGRQQLDVDRGQGIDRFERGRRGVEVDSGRRIGG